MLADPILESLFPAVRKEILGVMLRAPGHAWYMASLATRLGRQSCSLQRELAALSEAGILTRQQDGNRVYYQADTTCPVYPALSGLFNEGIGIAVQLRQALQPYSDAITAALVFGSTANNTATEESDIDVMIIGSVSSRQVAKPLRELERETGRSVDLFLMKPAAFRKKALSNDDFVRSVLDNSMLFVVGNHDDLARLTRPRPDRGTRPHQGRD